MQRSGARSTSVSWWRDRKTIKRSDVGVADRHGLLTLIPTIDDVLDEYASALGNDIVAYRHHVYRVVNLCAAMSVGVGRIEQFAVAGVFHDLGIWTDRTFDYIAPSIDLARRYLVARRREDWIPDISTTIAEHHKITRSTAAPSALVEAFRRADWVDVTGGLRGFGIPRCFIARLFATWPDAGFHRRLVQLAVRRLRTHPLHPLPMVKF
jgi:hypothetical protein